jgi:hypothetical protein
MLYINRENKCHTFWQRRDRVFFGNRVVTTLCTLLLRALCSVGISLIYSKVLPEDFKLF